MGNVHFYNEGSGGGNFNGTIAAEKVLVEQTTGLEANAQLEFQKQREILDDLYLRSEIGEILDYVHCTTDMVVNNIRVGNHIEFIPLVGNIEVSSGTGQERGIIKLKKGKVYKISFGFGAYARKIYIDLYNLTTKTIVESIGGLAGMYTEYINNSSLTHVIKPVSDMSIEFRFNTLESARDIRHVNLVVEEIGRTLIKDPIESAQKHQVEYGICKVSLGMGSRLVVNNHIEFDNCIGTIKMSTGVGQENGIIYIRGKKRYRIEYRVTGLFSIGNGIVLGVYDIKRKVLLSSVQLYGSVTKYINPVGNVFDTYFEDDSEIELRIVSLGSETIYDIRAETFVSIQEIASPLVLEYTKELNNPLSTKPLEYGTFHIPSPQVANLRTGNHVELEHLNGNIRCSKGIGQDKGIIALKGGITYELSSSFRMLGRNATLYLKNITTNELIYEMNGLGGAYQDYTTSNSFNGAYTPLEDCFIELNILAAEGISNLTTVLLFIKEIRNQGVNQYGGFETQVLFEGNTSANGEYRLIDSVFNYDFIYFEGRSNSASLTWVGGFSGQLSSEFISHNLGEKQYLIAFSSSGTSNYTSLGVSFKDLETMCIAIVNSPLILMRITKVVGIKGQLPSLLCGGEF